MTVGGGGSDRVHAELAVCVVDPFVRQRALSSVMIVHSDAMG